MWVAVGKGLNYANGVLYSAFTNQSINMGVHAFCVLIVVGQRTDCGSTSSVVRNANSTWTFTQTQCGSDLAWGSAVCYDY